MLLWKSNPVTLTAAAPIQASLWPTVFGGKQKGRTNPIVRHEQLGDIYQWSRDIESCNPTKLFFIHLCNLEFRIMGVNKKHRGERRGGARGLWHPRYWFFRQVSFMISKGAHTHFNRGWFNQRSKNKFCYTLDFYWISLSWEAAGFGKSIEINREKENHPSRFRTHNQSRGASLLLLLLSFN